MTGETKALYRLYLHGYAGVAAMRDYSDDELAVLVLATRDRLAGARPQQADALLDEALKLLGKLPSPADRLKRAFGSTN